MIILLFFMSVLASFRPLISMEATFGDCGCCDPDACTNICDYMSTQHATWPAVCDYCGDLCGTIEVDYDAAGFPCANATHTIRINAGYTINGVCGWKGLISFGGCSFEIGIYSIGPTYGLLTGAADGSTDLAGGSTLGGPYSPVSWSCSPFTIQFDLNTGTLPLCGDTCHYRIILTECP